MDHQLVVNREGQAGNVTVTDQNTSGLNFEIKTKEPASKRNRRNDDDSDYDNESVQTDVPMFVNELANPAKKGVYEGRHWNDASEKEDTATESDFSERRGRSKTRKRRRDSRPRSESAQPRPSPGFSSLKEERLHLCLALKRMKDEGVKGIINFDDDTSIEELRLELRALEQDELVRGGIMNCRSFLITMSAGIEIANKRFNPFDIELNGWSQHLYESIETFDGVFEKLTKKYAKRIGDIAPEAQLLMMLAGNAFSYCFMRSMIKACEPSMARVANENPDLVKKMMESIAAQQSQKQAQDQPFHDPQQPPQQFQPQIPQQTQLKNPTPGPIPVSTRGIFGMGSEALQEPQHLETIPEKAPPQPAKVANPMTGPDKDTLNALIQRAQRLATEASSDSSSLASFETESLDNMSVTDTVTSSVPEERPKRKEPLKGRGRAKKPAANVIDI